MKSHIGIPVAGALYLLKFAMKFRFVCVKKKSQIAIIQNCKDGLENKGAIYGYGYKSWGILPQAAFLTFFHASPKVVCS